MDLNQLVTFINLHGPTVNMATKGLTSALTLYGARTLTLSQAAAQAGLSEAEFVEQLERRGIDVTDSERAAALDTESTARAD